MTGGPGSGKSVVASPAGLTLVPQTLRKVAAHRNPRVEAMFKYFNQFMMAEENDRNVLIHGWGRHALLTSTQTASAASAAAATASQRTARSVHLNLIVAISPLT